MKVLDEEHVEVRVGKCRAVNMFYHTWADPQVEGQLIKIRVYLFSKYSVCKQEEINDPAESLPQ